MNSLPNMLATLTRIGLPVIPDGRFVMVMEGDYLGKVGTVVDSHGTGADTTYRIRVHMVGALTFTEYRAGAILESPCCPWCAEAATMIEKGSHRDVICATHARDHGDGAARKYADPLTPAMVARYALVELYR